MRGAGVRPSAYAHGEAGLAGPVVEADPITGEHAADLGISPEPITESPQGGALGCGLSQVSLRASLAGDKGLFRGSGRLGGASGGLGWHVVAVPVAGGVVQRHRRRTRVASLRARAL